MVLIGVSEGVGVQGGERERLTVPECALVLKEQCTCLLFEGYLEKFQNTKGRAGKKRVQVPPPKTVCSLPASAVSPFALKTGNVKLTHPQQALVLGLNLSLYGRKYEMTFNNKISNLINYNKNVFLWYFNMILWYFTPELKYL